MIPALTDEVDPSGLDAKEPGAKLDHGKPDYRYLFAQATRYCCHVLSMDEPGTGFFNPDLSPNLYAINCYLKSHLNLLPEVAELYAIGAKKYSPGGWLKVDDAVNRYGAAWSRHFYKWKVLGEEIDEETGVRHEVCCYWNLIAVYELGVIL